MPIQPSAKRPAWVWLISTFFFISACWTLLSFYLIHFEIITVPIETKQYFNTLAFQDHFITIVLGIINILAAIYLLLLKKISFYLFLSSLIINTLFTTLHAINKGLFAALSSGGLIGAIISYIILIGICLYSRKLMKSHILN
jgi:hypothetical protein